MTMERAHPVPDHTGSDGRYCHRAVDVGPGEIVLCALRALLITEHRLSPEYLVRCAVRTPCMAAVHELPRSWVNDPGQPAR